MGGCPVPADDVKALETAIRELHSPRSGTRRIENNVTLDPPKAVTFCSECEFVEYPCPTIRALEASLPSVEVGEDEIEALIAEWNAASVECENTALIQARSMQPTSAEVNLSRAGLYRACAKRLAALAARRTVAGEELCERCGPPHCLDPQGHATRETAAQDWRTMESFCEECRMRTRGPVCGNSLCTVGKKNRKRFYDVGLAATRRSSASGEQGEG
jgi:hypothetical protein